LHRGHVLDVKLRSAQVRATRTRLAAITLGMTFGTVFGLYLLWRTGEWALDKLVYENSTFAIQSIEVQTDGVIAPEQLRRWANVKPGANLVALDLASVKRNLQLVPAIDADSIRIERVLPRTLKIQVKERVPVAQVDMPTAGDAGGINLTVFELDTNGFVIRPLNPHERLVPLPQMSAQLPVLTGLNPLELQPGRRVASPQVLAALALIGIFDRSPMAGLVDLRHVDVSFPGVVVVTTGQGSEITFALENVAQQLGRWRKIYDFGKSLNKAIASADLAVSNNVPVHLITLDIRPVTPPKKSNPATNRRKNV
jgi:POTRA domain, FtsQ-type